MISKKSFRKFSNLVNGCRIVPPGGKVQVFPYCTDVIFLNRRNQLGFELNDGSYIRIDGVIATDVESFGKMLGAIRIVAKENGYTKLFYGDVLPDEVLQMFLNFGFTEKQVAGGSDNHYLYLALEGC